MELGCFYGHIADAVKEKGISLDEALSLAAAHGIKGLDVCSDYLEDMCPEDFQKMIAAHGMHAASVHGYFPCGVRTPMEYQASLDKMKSVMHLAKRAGSARFMPVPQPSESYLPEEDAQWREEMRRLLGDVIRYGKEIGLKVVVENFSLHEVPYTTFDDMDYLLAQNPDMDFTLDIGNFPLAGFDELEAARHFLSRIGYVHLKDLVVVENPEHPEMLLLRGGKYYDSLEIGGGFLKNKEVIEFLQEKGYDGSVIIEVNCGPNVFDRTLQSACYLKNII